MVDPLDPGTMALPLTFKRGRGRPRKLNALTPAERARRYRARKKTLAMHVVPASVYAEALRERDEARTQLDQLRRDLEQLRSHLIH